MRKFKIQNSKFKINPSLCRKGGKKQSFRSLFLGDWRTEKSNVFGSKVRLFAKGCFGGSFRGRFWAVRGGGFALFWWVFFGGANGAFSPFLTLVILLGSDPRNRHQKPKMHADKFCPKARYEHFAGVLRLSKTAILSKIEICRRGVCFEKSKVLKNSEIRFYA